jgi:NAD(P)H-dependent flavin oxidoreductase YrpB (nitropropane dioxygenase family)
MAGQSAGLINEVKTVSELLDSLMEKTECTLRSITRKFCANSTK